MDIGFEAVYRKLSPLLTNTFCYYKDKLLKSDINGYKAEIISVSPSPDGDIVVLKVLNDGTRILDDFLINLTGAYEAVINDIYENIKIISHTSDMDSDYIECLGIPSPIASGVDEIESINFILKSATKFSYGKFQVGWKPRGMCLFEGLNIDIEITTKDDEERVKINETTNLLISILLKSTSFKIDDDGKIGYFKMTGRPTISKGHEDGENAQSTIVSFSGYYQINYHV
jgi:hypothetical protein